MKRRLRMHGHSAVTSTKSIIGIKEMPSYTLMRESCMQVEMVGLDQCALCEAACDMILIFNLVLLQHDSNFQLSTSELMA